MKLKAARATNKFKQINSKPTRKPNNDNDK